MKKPNLLKLTAILATLFFAGFTSISTHAEGTGTVTDTWSTTVNLEIIGWTVTIDAPAVLDFGTGVAKADTGSLLIDMRTYSGWLLYFELEDLRGWANGYYTTLGISNMTSWNAKVIDKFNVKITGNNDSTWRPYWDDNNTWTIFSSKTWITKLDWLDGQEVPPEVNIPSSIFNVESSLGLPAPITVLQRDFATTPDPSIIWKYGLQPTFKAYIPKYQEIGQYTSTMTFTLTEK